MNSKMQRVNSDEIEIEYTEGGSPLYTWEGEPFTGVAFDVDDSGNLISEITYQEGIENGSEKNWYPDGQLESVRNNKWNRIHGDFKEWYPDGQVKIEGKCELGYVVWRKSWDDAGNLTEEYDIENHPERLNVLLREKLFFTRNNLL